MIAAAKPSPPSRELFALFLLQDVIFFRCSGDQILQRKLAFKKNDLRVIMNTDPGKKWRQLFREHAFDNVRNYSKGGRKNVHKILTDVEVQEESANYTGPMATAFAKKLIEAGDQMLIEYARHVPEAENILRKKNEMAVNVQYLEKMHPDIHRHIQTLERNPSINNGSAKVEADKKVREKIMIELTEGRGHLRGPAPRFKELYNDVVERLKQQLIDTPRFMAGAHSEGKFGVIENDLYLAKITASTQKGDYDFARMVKDILEHRRLYEKLVKVFTELTRTIANESAREGSGREEIDFVLGIGLKTNNRFRQAFTIQQHPKVGGNVNNPQMQTAIEFYEKVNDLHTDFKRVTNSYQGESQLLYISQVILLCARVSGYLMLPRGNDALASKVLYCMYPHSSDMLFILNVPRESQEMKQKPVNYVTTEFFKGMDLYLKNDGCSGRFANQEMIKRLEPFWMYGFPIYKEDLMELMQSYQEERVSLTTEFERAILDVTASSPATVSLDTYYQIFDAVITPEDAQFIEYLSEPIKTNNWTGAPGVSLGNCMSSVEDLFVGDDPTSAQSKLPAEMCGMKTPKTPCDPQEQRRELQNDSCNWSSFVSETQGELERKIFASQPRGVCGKKLCELIVGGNARLQPVSQGSVAPGLRVHIQNLEDRVEYNGLIGTVVETTGLAGGGRVQVKVDGLDKTIDIFPEKLFVDKLCTEAVLRQVKPVARGTKQDFIRTLQSIVDAQEKKTKTCADIISDNQCFDQNGVFQEDDNCIEAINGVLRNPSDARSYNCDTTGLKIDSRTMTACELLKLLRPKNARSDGPIKAMIARIGCDAKQDADRFFKEVSWNNLDVQWQGYMQRTQRGRLMKVTSKQIQNFVDRMSEEINRLVSNTTQAINYENALETFRTKHEKKYRIFIECLRTMLEENYKKSDRGASTLQRFISSYNEDYDDYDDDSFNDALSNYMLSVVLFGIIESAEGVKGGEDSLRPMALVVLFESMQKYAPKQFSKLAYQLMKNGGTDDNSVFANELLILNTHRVSKRDGRNSLFCMTATQDIINLFKTKFGFDDDNLGTNYTLPAMLDRALTRCEKMDNSEALREAGRLERTLLVVMFSPPSTDDHQQECTHALHQCFNQYKNNVSTMDTDGEEDDVTELLDFLSRFRFYVNYLFTHDRNLFNHFLGRLQEHVAQWIGEQKRRLPSTGQRRPDSQVAEEWLRKMGINDNVTPDYLSAVSRLIKVTNDYDKAFNYNGTKFCEAHLLLLEASFTEYAIKHRNASSGYRQQPTSQQLNSKSRGIRAWINPNDAMWKTFREQYFWSKLRDKEYWQGTSMKELDREVKRQNLQRNTAPPSPKELQTLFTTYKTQMGKNPSEYSNALLLNIDYNAKAIRKPTELKLNDVIQAIDQLTLCIKITERMEEKRTISETYGDALFLFELFRIHTYRGKYDDALQLRVLPTRNYSNALDVIDTHLPNHVIHDMILDIDATRSRYSLSNEKGRQANVFYYKNALDITKGATCNVADVPDVKCSSLEYDSEKV